MSDLDRLIRFVAVAEELSFSRAARRLNVDQPWLSRQISQLEAQLDLSLFSRSSRKVELTEEGQQLLEQARELAKVASSCKTVMRELSQTKRAVLNIGVGPYTYWLPKRREILAQFESRHPRVTVNLSSDFTPGLVGKLRARVLDAIIVPHDAAFDDLDALIIEDAAPTLLIPSEDPLAQVGPIQMSQIAGRKIAVTDPKLNPSMYALHYQPFIDAGAVPVIVPEGQNAIPFYTRSTRIIAVNLGGPIGEMQWAGDFQQVEIAGLVHRIRYSLLTQPEPMRALLGHFWRLAQDVVGVAPDAAATSLAAAHARTESKPLKLVA